MKKSFMPINSKTSNRYKTNPPVRDVLIHTSGNGNISIYNYYVKKNIQKYLFEGYGRASH